MLLALGRAATFATSIALPAATYFYLDQHRVQWANSSRSADLLNALGVNSQQSLFDQLLHRWSLTPVSAAVLIGMAGTSLLSTIPRLPRRLFVCQRGASPLAMWTSLFTHAHLAHFVLCGVSMYSLLPVFETSYINANGNDVYQPFLGLAAARDIAAIGVASIALSRLFALPCVGSSGIAFGVLASMSVYRNLPINLCM
ncbi:MAG: hypothetical protein MHM6MM_007343, partial [Cercozoa sp. M6MM]